MLRLSVLDQSTIVSGRSPDASIRESLALARACDELGYARYWVAEHHNSDAIAGTAPEILIAAIAATTTRIRVGSAGVMLPHYSALKVAEQFRVLDAIAPGRIDLGVGRAPGSDMMTAHALNPNAATAAERFPAQIRDMLDWLAGRPLVDAHPFREVAAQPRGPHTPEVWVLGSSDYGAQVAAHFGLPYCFAHFITDGAGAERAIATYKALYRPSERHPEPRGALCVWAVAAETESAAEQLYAPRAIWRLGRDRGVYAPLPRPEEVAAVTLDAAQREHLARLRERAILGTPAAVGDKLRALAERTGIEEIAVLTTVPDPDARRRSYELLAREFGLS
ncbi:MAG: LLM class flavin-dependent oxidoreductase [Acetobacteraceae bacterium]|nr:LLM class flavin-dependent oxidoreductase [Acetobacteraceae bacterium]